MPTNYEIEVVQRLTRLEAKLDQLVNIPVRVAALEVEAKRFRGYVTWVGITLGGGISILLGDLLIRLLHAL